MGFDNANVKQRLKVSTEGDNGMNFKRINVTLSKITELILYIHNIFSSKGRKRKEGSLRRRGLVVPLPRSVWRPLHS